VGLRERYVMLWDNVYINGRVVLSSKIRIEVGDSTLIGHKTLIFATDWHGIDGQHKAAPILIGKQVSIGAKAIILMA
jgi:acetyltransferase-like isoleucine patch superfamily enzyme